MKGLSLSILDFTSRLPGPLGTSLLQDLGARVVKYELKSQRDAFFSSELAKEIPEFKNWYKVLNHGKKIILFDETDVGLVNWQRKHLSQAQILLLPKSRAPWARELKKDWLKLEGARVLIEVAGAKNGGPMQDLLAQVQAGLIQTHLRGLKLKKRELPTLSYVPLAGIVFGHQLATSALALWVQAEKEKKSLHEEIFLEGLLEKNLKFLQKRPGAGFLHQGARACYNLYPLKDHGYLALACLEREHYLRARAVLEFPVAADLRMSADPKVIGKMQRYVAQLSFAQLQKKLGRRPWPAGVSSVQE